MTIIETTARVDEHGNVTVTLPEPFRNQGRTVFVTLSTPEVSLTQAEWVERVNRTAGIIDDPTFVAPPELPLDPAPALD